MLDVQLQDLALHITIDRGLDFSNESDVAPGKAHPLNEVLGSVLSYRLRSLSMKHEAAETYGVLSTELSLQGFSIECAQPQNANQPG